MDRVQTVMEAAEAAMKRAEAVQERARAATLRADALLRTIAEGHRLSKRSLTRSLSSP
jgi:hypothetical protein